MRCTGSSCGAGSTSAPVRPTIRGVKLSYIIIFTAVYLYLEDKRYLFIRILKMRGNQRPAGLPDLLLACRGLTCSGTS
jgi:hypothetical protein